MAHRVGRGIALLFHDHGTRRGWVVSVTPRPYFTPGKDPVPIAQEAVWAPGPVRKGGKSCPTGIWSLDLPACSQLLYQLSYPAHRQEDTYINYSIIYFFIVTKSGLHSVFCLPLLEVRYLHFSPPMLLDSFVQMLSKDSSLLDCKTNNFLTEYEGNYICTNMKHLKHKSTFKDINFKHWYYSHSRSQA